MDKFKGLTDKESIALQVKEWVKGNPLHNTIRDECCPDFSCCNGGNIMPKEVREKFMDAYKNNDEKLMWDIMGTGLGMLLLNTDIKVYVAGQEASDN